VTEATATEMTERTVTERTGRVSGWHPLAPYPPFPLAPCAPFPLALIASTLLIVALSACGGPAVDARTGVAAPPAAAVASQPHGDHNPHHGGVVMMKGDNLHYEVVVDPTGRAHAVYFTDAVRDELPASIASAVALTIKRPGASDERIPLHIDDAGESWIGTGAPIGDVPHATVRVDWIIRGEPYWIDLAVPKK
jgi:hypothetical protein